MITVAQPLGPFTSYRIKSDGKVLCTVEPVMASAHGFRNPDWKATRKRAEHIAAALRHYQASQGSEVTP